MPTKEIQSGCFIISFGNRCRNEEELSAIKTTDTTAEFLMMHDGAIPPETLLTLRVGREYLRGFIRFGLFGKKCWRSVVEQSFKEVVAVFLIHLQIAHTCFSVCFRLLVFVFCLSTFFFLCLRHFSS